MKIAILGRSPIALEAALTFHSHGAAVTWFVDKEEHSLFTTPEFTSADFVSELGQVLLKEMGLTYIPKKFTWKDWLNFYEAPLIEYLRRNQEVRTDEVVSITKRFLAPGEEISGRSRFLDLFRIIYKVNPKDFIEEQRETNPETYERLTEEFVHSLASSIEMYQDFDLILDLRNDLSKSSIAASGRALGEGRTSDKINYSTAALKFATGLLPAPDNREMFLVGSDSLAAEILLALEVWLKEPRSRLFVASTEADPFSRFLVEATPASAEKLTSLFGRMDEEFEKEVQTFTHKLREWQELDDFVQVKIPKPVEPIPRLVYFSGHNITAVDELIDRKRMFVTLEKPEFRSGVKHPENNHLDLKTIGVDQILVSHAKKDFSILQIDPNEVGFFTLTPSRPNVGQCWEHDLQKLKGIEDEVFKLFSPADTH